MGRSTPVDMVMGQCEIPEEVVVGSPVISNEVRILVAQPAMFHQLYEFRQ